VSPRDPETRSLPGDRLPSPGDWPEFELLAGVRVLDLTSSIAGPYSTLLLGDLGADVVKIEQPGTGDDTRHWGPPFLEGESLWYLSSNRNKSSVTLDLRSPSGAEVLQRLICVADALIVNLRPGAQERLGVAYPQVAATRPDIIHCSITGFGLTGERADLACYDLIAEGFSGIMDLTGEADGPPQKVGTPAADLLAGMDAALAVVAALLDRARTGRGHQIDVSLTESITRFLAPRLVSYLGSGELPHRTGGRDSVIAIYQRFETSDGSLTLGLGNDRIFARFCAAIGKPQWAEDPRNLGNQRRRERRADLVAQIQSVISTRTGAEWLSLFKEHGIPAGPINTLADVAVDQSLIDRGVLYAIVEEGTAPIPQVGTAWHLDGAPNGRARRPPALGADTADALERWLKMNADEIDQLRADGVV
jgi:crotonobetainyl-CoA:carnitine CoA-transferase CaiB-like acyl-CoA transferase